ncbi:RadC family protein [Bacteroides sp. 51]|uniref:JAB domain-containing protein n=1 Tax=Bacteroides sp. 51 TaxID=2302938 RepID=UPI0013D773E3|nr:JAB domain-containing protein [Bacteroides sp. 51]NDV83536.1 DNA repair protein [Bacteroides sp. 51]
MAENFNLFKVNEVRMTYKSKVKASERPKLTTSQEVYELLMKIYDENTIELKEYFKVILLNQANKVLGVHNLSSGGIDGTYADVRQILQIAILSNAIGIIISHNHPSGNTSPSVNDRKLTTTIKQACDIMNIRLLDHVIVTKDEGYYSFTDEGELL